LHLRQRCQFWATLYMMSHDSARCGILCVKIRSGVWLVGWAKKKGIYICSVCIKKNDSSKKTPISPEDRREPISTKFGTAGRFADLIICDNCFGNRLRGFESVRGQILPFFYSQAVAINTMLALPRSLWFSENLHVLMARKYFHLGHNAIVFIQVTRRRPLRLSAVLCRTLWTVKCSTTVASTRLKTTTWGVTMATDRHSGSSVSNLTVCCEMCHVCYRGITASKAVSSR